jgi:hypothetical protein
MNWFKRVVFPLVLCGSVTVFLPSMGGAQEPVEEPRQRFEIAAGTWISSGETRWAHNASSSSPLLGNPTSKLTHKDVATNVFDLAGTYWFRPRLFGRLNIGVAGIGGGRLTDDDYLAADGGNPSSRTISNINGNGMWYLNADVGGRVTNFINHRGWLDMFGGFQYWHTEYTAVGLGQVTCTSAGANTDLDPFKVGTQALCPNSVSGGTTVITNTTNWYSMRLGGRTEYRLTRQFSLLGSVALLPVSIVENKDVHHLRSDLQQNPSISMLGIGIGADADVGAKFMFTKNVGLNVGYRVWWNRMYDGDVTFHNVGSSQEFPLTQFQSLRHGFTAGLNFTF